LWPRERPAVILTTETGMGVDMAVRVPQALAAVFSNRAAASACSFELKSRGFVLLEDHGLDPDEAGALDDA
jgi:hypothetical protein